MPKRGIGFGTLAENWRGAEYRLDKGVVDKALEGEGNCSREDCVGVPENRWVLRRGVTGAVLRETTLSVGAHYDVAQHSSPGIKMKPYI